jgi:hypothetical protein
MILELNGSSIMYFNTDKLINITIFEKYGLGTLDNLKLRINMGNDLIYLNNSPLLGYVLYYMASMMIKMKVYEVENPNIDVKKIIPPIDRLRIMHSIVHLLSIIINRKIKDTNYLYTILGNNYFIKLLTIYQNANTSETLLKDIRYFSQKKIDNTPSKKLITKKQIYHMINGVMEHYQQYSSLKIDKEKKDINPMNIFANKINIFLRYFPIAILKDKYILSDEEKNKLIKKDLLWLYNRDSSAVKLNIDIIKLDSLSLTDLLNIKSKYNTLIKNQIDKQRKKLLDSKEYQIKKVNKLKTLVEILNEELLPFDEILEKFLLKVEKYVSSGQSIYQDNYYLRNSVFTINHDFAGFPIKPYNIDKITIKYKDSITNKDVIIYKEKDTYRYYDIYTLSYLGYKTDKTDFNSVINSQYLIIHYSLMDKIKYLGTYRKYVNIVPLDKQIIYQSKFRGDILYDNTDLLNQVIKTKINHDKIVIEKFQRILYRIKNNKRVQQENKQDKPLEETKEKLLINEFIPRLTKLSIMNDEFILFLQNWKSVIACVNFIPVIDDKLVNNLILDSDTINSNTNYNLLMRYLLTQLIKLLEMNTDKTNINLCPCIAMIFDLMWKEYNVNNNYEINKFLLLLNSLPDDNFMNSYDIEDTAPETIIKEQIKPKTEAEEKEDQDKKDDFKEENDAIDVEGTEPEDLDLGEQDVIMYDREEF